MCKWPVVSLSWHPPKLGTNCRACLAWYIAVLASRSMNWTASGQVESFMFSPDYEVHAKPHAYVECTHSVHLSAEEKIEMISGSSADAKFSGWAVWTKISVETVVCPPI